MLAVVTTPAGDSSHQTSNSNQLTQPARTADPGDRGTLAAVNLVGHADRGTFPIHTGMTSTLTSTPEQVIDPVHEFTLPTGRVLTLTIDEIATIVNTANNTFLDQAHDIRTHTRVAQAQLSNYGLAPVVGHYLYEHAWTKPGAFGEYPYGVPMLVYHTNPGSMPTACRSGTYNTSLADEWQLILTGAPLEPIATAAWNNQEDIIRLAQMLHHINPQTAAVQIQLASGVQPFQPKHSPVALQTAFHRIVDALKPCPVINDDTLLNALAPELTARLVAIHDPSLARLVRLPALAFVSYSRQNQPVLNACLAENNWELIDHVQFERVSSLHDRHTLIGTPGASDALENLTVEEISLLGISELTTIDPNVTVPDAGLWDDYSFSEYVVNRTPLTIHEADMYRNEH